MGMKHSELEYYLNKCSTPSDFAIFAKKNGASVRCKKHYCIKHCNGETTVISSTPRPKIPLHKTMNEFKRIYLKKI